MKHAEICPVCGGKGKVPNDKKVTAPIEKTCHGCFGSGWVTVGGEYPTTLTIYKKEQE